jgi:hypothetical protein
MAEGVAPSRLGGRRELPEVLPEHDEAVWRAGRTLPRRQAQVVALHDVDDRSVAEIATILELAEGTVKAHLQRRAGHRGTPSARPPLPTPGGRPLTRLR